MNADATKLGRARVLCVDDEPHVLEGLGLHLRRKFELFTATGGDTALDLLAANPGIAVIMSDMRMPRMDGATFLARARAVVPDAVRILLTGQTDLGSAIAAVNEGQIFRFLTKPAAPAAVQRAIEAALEQYRLVTAERVLLEETLLGSTKTLADVLALANPAAFGRSARIKQLVAALAEHLELPSRWQLEMAAMFSQLGAISLPEETLSNLYRGEEPSPEDRAMMARAHTLTDQLLGNIPRLETVRAIIAGFAKGPSLQWRALSSADPTAQLVKRGADLLRLAVDFDTLEAQGQTSAVAFDTLRSRAARYDPALLDALSAIRGGGPARREVKEVGVWDLRAGMVFVDDVKLKTGGLLVVRGYEVSASFLERVRNHAANIKEPLRVMIRPAGPLAHG